MQIKKPAPGSIARAMAALAMLSCLIAAPARAEEVKAGDLVITQAWTRATPGGARIGGGYLTIENKGAAPDRLIGGSADFAGKIEVHEMAMNNGVMTMRPLDKGLAIEPGKTANASPIGFDPGIDTKAFLKLVPAKLAGPGLIANHRERGCICHQCYYRSVDATL